MTTIDIEMNAAKQNDTERAIKAFLERVGKAVVKTGTELVQYGPRAAVDMADVFLKVTAVAALIVGVIFLCQNSALFAALLVLAITIKLLNVIIAS